MFRIHDLKLPKSYYTFTRKNREMKKMKRNSKPRSIKEFLKDLEIFDCEEEIIERSKKDLFNSPQEDLTAYLNLLTSYSTRLGCEIGKLIPKTRIGNPEANQEFIHMSELFVRNLQEQQRVYNILVRRGFVGNYIKHGIDSERTAKAFQRTLRGYRDVCEGYADAYGLRDRLGDLLRNIGKLVPVEDLIPYSIQ